MNFKTAIGDLKAEIDGEIEIYLDENIKKTKKINPVAADGLKHVKKIILAGGKRIRPALMFFGYMAAGGKERDKALKASVGIELIHAFLLIHDDIMDRGKKRHGVDTLNARYEKIGKNFFFQGNSGHFGNSMAIVLGDMVNTLGNNVIFSSGFDPRLVVRALQRLQSIVALTAVGQIQDVYIESVGKARQKEILKMYENKTARYTIEGPLHLGAVLAGGEEKLLEGLSRYALPIGVAFQIQDDILGIFGSEKQMGKSAGSDIEEGKQTILVAKAGEKADKFQKRILNETLGKKKLTEKDKEDFQKIIIKTGALDSAREMARKLVWRGKRELVSLRITKEAKDFLNGMADYMIQREL